MNPNGKNTFSVVRTASRTVYLINGEAVFDEPYRHFYTNNIGYYLEGNTTILAEELRVYD